MRCNVKYSQCRIANVARPINFCRISFATEFQVFQQTIDSNIEFVAYAFDKP